MSRFCADMYTTSGAKFSHRTERCRAKKIDTRLSTHPGYLHTLESAHSEHNSFFCVCVHVYMCVCLFFLIQIDRMLRRLCAHYNYTHLRNAGSRCWRRGCNQRSLSRTHTHARADTHTHLTFLQRLATHLFALESNARM